VAAAAAALAALGSASSVRAEPLSIDDALRAAEPASESVAAARADVDRAVGVLDDEKSCFFQYLYVSSQYEFWLG
jgi:hypothetical protein